MKAEADKLNVHKLKIVPVDLSKLSNVLDNDVLKKTMYGKLVAKVNNFDTSGLVLKTKYDTEKFSDCNGTRARSFLTFRQM